MLRNCRAHAGRALRPLTPRGFACAGRVTRGGLARPPELSAAHASAYARVGRSSRPALLGARAPPRAAAAAAAARRHRSSCNCTQACPALNHAALCSRYLTCRIPGQPSMSSPQHAAAAALLAALLLAASPTASATGLSGSFEPTNPFGPPNTAPPVPGCTTYWFTQVGTAACSGGCGWLGPRGAALPPRSHDLTARKHPPRAATTLPSPQRVDHFSPWDRRTFQQRYTVCDAYWGKGPKEPLFMYLGGWVGVGGWAGGTRFLVAGAREAGRMGLWSAARSTRTPRMRAAAAAAASHVRRGAAPADVPRRPPRGGAEKRCLAAVPLAAPRPQATSRPCPAPGPPSFRTWLERRRPRVGAACCCMRR